MAGIVLHDIGKVKGLQFTTEAEYTDAGKLIGHITLGLATTGNFLIIYNRKEYSSYAKNCKTNQNW